MRLAGVIYTLFSCRMAHAQPQEVVGPALDPDLLSWFGSTAAFAGTLVVLVSFVRGYLWTGLSGPRVGWFTLALGSVLGALGQAAGYVRVEPYASLPLPVGGAVFGLVAAVGAVGFVAQVYRTVEKVPAAQPATPVEAEGHEVRGGARGVGATTSTGEAPN